MALDLKRFRKKRFIEFFLLQFLRNFSNSMLLYGSQHNNCFRICYTELTLLGQFFRKKIDVGTLTNRRFIS
ncbi:conserved hypothetical protein [Leptospira interrogans serovar Manilae]|uniref:Uncharacterized protein n=1 Tax=Leptospira interrogans serovar Manilae TaxID=214675 RepID=A0AAQ1NZL0_LEPIR|nr:conserved hypothetical protein [Leptospira interrogans serovar Manilae]